MFFRIFIESWSFMKEIKLIDELIMLIVENDLKLNNEMLKRKTEQIETFYSEK